MLVVDVGGPDGRVPRLAAIARAVEKMSLTFVPANARRSGTRRPPASASTSPLARRTVAGSRHRRWARRPATPALPAGAGSERRQRKAVQGADVQPCGSDHAQVGEVLQAGGQAGQVEGLGPRRRSSPAASYRPGRSAPRPWTGRARHSRAGRVAAGPLWRGGRLRTVEPRRGEEHHQAGQQRRDAESSPGIRISQDGRSAGELLDGSHNHP